MTSTDTLYRYDFSKNRLTKTEVSGGKIFSSVEIAQSLNQNFFLRSIYGISVIDNLGNQFFRHNKGGTVNQVKNTISLPVNDTLNLLSGDNLGLNKGSLLAMNNENEILWEKPISVANHFVDLKLFNYPSFFLVCNVSSISALRKKDGEIIWEKVFDRDFKIAFASRNRLVLVFVSNDPPFSTVPLNHGVVIASIKINSLKYEANYKAKMLGDIYVGLVKDKLIISDLNASSLINLHNNRIEKKEQVKSSKTDGFKFHNINDIHSFNSYIYSYDGIIYW